jgi:thioredoxin
MGKVLKALVLLLLCAEANGQARFVVDAETFRTKVGESAGAEILDVRTPAEYQQGYIPQATNIDYNNANFQDKISALDKSKPYFVYCLSGGRSSDAAKYMRSAGFKEVYELKDGILKWKQSLEMPAGRNDVADKLSAEDYKKLTTSSQAVVMDFYAPWCGPCKVMEPMLKELAGEQAGKITVVRINIDENKNLARSMSISEIPVVKIYRDGKETWSRVGMTDKRTIVKQLSGR